MPKSSEWSLPFKLSSQIFIRIYISPVCAIYIFITEKL
jgi:hypothetical protein